MDANRYLGLGVVHLDRTVRALDGRYTREIYGHVVRRQVNVPGRGLQPAMIYVFRRRPPELARPTQVARFIIAARHMVHFVPELPKQFGGFNARRFVRQGNHRPRQTQEAEPCERSN